MKFLLLLLTLVASEVCAQTTQLVASRPLCASQLDTLAQRHRYTWLVIWAPGCGPWEQLADSYQKFITQHAERDIQLVLVAVQYAPHNTSTILTRLRFTSPTYFVDSIRYAKSGSQGFQRELNKTIKGRKYRHANHYIYERGKGVIYTSDVPEADFVRLKTVFRI